MRLLDRNFKYIPSSETDVAATWRRFGFRPTTEKERRARGPERTAVPRGLAGVTQINAQERTEHRRKLKLAIGK